MVSSPIPVLADDDNSSESDDDHDSMEEMDDDSMDDMNDDSDENEDNSGKEGRERDRNKIEFEREDGSMVEIERKIEFEDDERRIEIKRKITDRDGNEIEIKIKIETEDGKRKIKVERNLNRSDIEAETDLIIEELLEGNESVIRAILSNGNKTRILIMPDRISDIALERLRSKNFTIELKEIRHKNIPRVIYNIHTNKHGKFLGVFKKGVEVEAQIDPETGEVIGISKPWWAFLVVGEDSDQTDDENDSDDGDEHEEGEDESDDGDNNETNNDNNETNDEINVTNTTA